MSGKLSPARLKVLGNVALALLAVITGALVLTIALAPKSEPVVSDKVQSYYDEASKKTAGATPTADPAAVPVVVSVLSDSHAFNAGSWFRNTVEAGKVPGVKMGVFVSQPGASAEVLAGKLDEASASKGVVIIQAGTNDLLSARGSENTVAGIEALVEGVKERGAKPVLALIPPSAERGYEVLDANALLTEYAKANKVGVLDLTSSVATETGEWKDGLSGDGVHANPAGSKLISDAAAQQIPVLIR